MRRYLRGASWPLYVVAEQDVLIANVEFSIGDHGLRPGAVGAAVGLIDAAGFFPTIGRWFDQHDGSLAPFCTADEMPVGMSDGPFAELTGIPEAHAALR